MIGRRGLLCAVLVFSFIAGMATAEGATTEEPTPFQVLERVEGIVYGEVRSGGLIPRLGQVEKDLFGRELPGSIAERQQALLNFLEIGTEVQPSMLFKLGVAEWAVAQRIMAQKDAKSRIEALEVQLEGERRPEGALAMRLERLVTLLLPEGVTWSDVNLPARIAFRVRFLDTITPKLAKVGDRVRLELDGTLAVDGNLVAANGCLISGHVEEVKPPRSFGRASEVKFAFDHLRPLGPHEIPIVLGEEAKKAAETDTAVMAAAGASFFGLVLLGPVGLAGGFLVRGDEKDIPAGTLIYLETSQDTQVKGYPVPEGLKGLLPQPQAETVEASGDAGGVKQ